MNAVGTSHQNGVHSLVVLKIRDIGDFVLHKIDVNNLVMK